MLQTTFGASCMNRASVFEWHKRFMEGTESVRDDERCERRLLRRGLGFHVYTINKSAHTKKGWKLIVCPSYIDLEVGCVLTHFNPCQILFIHIY